MGIGDFVAPYENFFLYLKRTTPLNHRRFAFKKSLSPNFEGFACYFHTQSAKIDEGYCGEAMTSIETGRSTITSAESRCHSKCSPESVYSVKSVGCCLGNSQRDAP